MTNKELAQKLLDLLGGKDNVLANAACMTRLRVTVKDTGNVDTEGIKALDGVMGLVEDDTMQIVLGPGKVNKVLEEFSKLTGLAKGVADESVVDAAATNKAAQKAKYEEINKMIADFVPGVPLTHAPPSLAFGKGVQGYVPSPVQDEVWNGVTITK